MKMKEQREIEIWRYIDNVLTPEEKAIFERRLLEDDELAKAYSDLRHFDQKLQSQILHKAPRSLRRSVLNKIRTEEALVNQSLRVLFAVFIFIGLAAAVGAFIAIDRIDITRDLMFTFSDSLNLLASPIVMSLAGVLLLALLLEVYLLKPKTPR